MKLDLKTILYLLLAICAFSANNIIIYNEEILVALSFFSFVAFVVHYFGKTLSESLDSSSQAIQEICENLTNSQKQHLSQLYQELDKSLDLKKQCAEFMALTSSQLKLTTPKNDSMSGLRLHFYQASQNQFNQLKQMKQQLPVSVADLVASIQPLWVLTQMKKGDTSYKLYPKSLFSLVRSIVKK